ncbi:MAG: glycosyltransferase family 2 protein [Clostridia bacterium]|nr:glycosyltransferase family 2 protein [Clostridia bacterium]
MNPLISIIVPVYKVEKYLNRCLQSIAGQTYGNLEIILVDDGSPDGCPQLCDQWAAKDKRFKVIHKQNGGPSAARNAALEIARGDYFYFVDSDDYVEPTLCEKVMELFERFSVDIVTFNAMMVDETDKQIGAVDDVPEGLMEQEQALSALMKGKINHYAWNKMYKRHLFDGICFPEGRLWEDVAISHKLFLRTPQIYCSAERLYYYVQREGSIIRSINEKTLVDIFLARYESYTGVKEVYPGVGLDALPLAAESALNLFDRSLWAQVDENVLKSALEFLQENKGQILQLGSARHKLYLKAPALYVLLRKSKHLAGEMVRKVRG